MSNPPDAAALMTSARSFGSYDLPAALSDLIDNSIKARSRNIWVTCSFGRGDLTVSLEDDGEGMSADELQAAMRPASKHPEDARSPDDLGRFGWGLKAASFSQCRVLTVVSAKGGYCCGASWNLDDISSWRMGVLSDDEINTACPQFVGRIHGTSVIWSRCDRLSDDGALTEDAFNALIVHAKLKLALTYHRFLEGKVRGRKLTISFNGQVIEPLDPFHTPHNATQELPGDELSLDGKKIVIRPFVLPHYSKLGLIEYDKLGGEEGYIRNQGFYVYRGERLIISGTWFRLVKHGELSQLVRIAVDIPNSLDSIWKISVDKSNAQLPALLRNRLKQVVDRLRLRSSNIFRSRGGRLDLPTSMPIWSRHARDGAITYSINREHPLIVALTDTSDATRIAATEAMLKLIEQGFPVSAFGTDTMSSVGVIHQTEDDPHDLLALLDTSLPHLLASASGDMDAMVRGLKASEPFSLNWKVVQEHLIKKRWIQ